MSGIEVTMSGPGAPSIRVVGSGVDTVHLSARGELSDVMVERLTELRRGAEKGADPTSTFRSDGANFLVRGHGVRGYPFWVSGVGYDLKVGASEPFPPVLAELRSWFLHDVGAAAAVIQVERRLAADFFKESFEMLPSRMDVYADTQVWAPNQHDFERFVCRAKRRELYQPEGSLHGYGNEVSGYTFGKGAVVGRVYNKTLEQRVKGDTGASAHWVGADPDLPVWRIEFQFRREALVELGLGAMAALLANRQALWLYGMEWLSLRERSSHAKRSRWPEDAMWTWLKSAEIGLSCSPLVRQRMRGANRERVLRGLAGYLSSLAAIVGSKDLVPTVQRALPLVEHYMDDRGQDFGAIASRKSARLRAVLGPSADE